MDASTDDWESRLAALWAALDALGDDDFRARIDALAAELPQDSPVGLFERASAWDSTGHSDRAVPLYRAALERGLEGLRRRRAVIQLASSLRNLGEAAESVELLRAERARTSDALDDAVAAFLALALADRGETKAALALALAALARHLPRYQRSVRRYADALASPDDSSGRASGASATPPTLR